MTVFLRSLMALALVCLTVSCTSLDKSEKTEDDGLRLRQATWAQLPGWHGDRHADALPALRRSCARMAKKDPQAAMGPGGLGGTYGDWLQICSDAAHLPDGKDAAARQFFEKWFTPYRAQAGRKKQGLFTGYYEPELHGARERRGPYQTPLHVVPPDLVTVDLGAFSDDLKGKRIAGRVNGRKLVPYDTRADIVAGALDEKELELVWVDDPVDAFFLQIQGSGRVTLDDGSVMRVGYAGQNGHAYYAVGRELIKRGAVAKEDMSLQAIRDWMRDNPGEAAGLMNLNPSYVFFTELDGDGPLGGSGVALTPGRSLAVDYRIVPYGVPVWLDAQGALREDARLQRLMVAQDTGGAIRGAVRGDVFWGHGPGAELRAGKMKSKGGYWLLLPRGIEVAGAKPPKRGWWRR